MSRLGFLLACASLLFILPADMPNRAAAQSVGQGTLNAVSYFPLPGGTSIAVRPLDDTDDNLILQDEFERRLRAQGYTVSADAPLVLTFETRDEIGAWSDSGQRRPLELKQSQAASGIQDPRVQLNLYDSKRGGVFNEGRGRTAITTPGRYRLDASIDDRSNGQRLWQGWSVAELGAFDSLQLTRAMVPAIVGSIGQTLKRQPFNLP